MTLINMVESYKIEIELLDIPYSTRYPGGSFYIEKGRYILKKNGFIILSLALVIVTTACAKAATPTAPATPTPIEPTPVTTPVEKPIPEPLIPPSHYEEVAEGVSPLTGLPYEGDGKAIMVQIENTAAARPQSGISKADLIYEVEVESSTTRLTAFFLSSYPQKVGPVRSARKQHMQIWKEWDYLYVFFGGSYGSPGQDPDELIAEYKITSPTLNGIRTTKSFTRATDREAPHNAYTNLAYAIENAYDYTPKQRTLYFDKKAPIEGSDAKKISLSYASSNKITYEYDKDKGLYRRFINEKPVIDKEDNSKLEVKNIIVQYAKHYPIVGTVLTNIDLIGSRKAEYFTEGVKRTGTWERKDVFSLTRYYDEDGREISFKPGKTYVQIVRLDSEVIAE